MLFLLCQNTSFFFHLEQNLQAVVVQSSCRFQIQQPRDTMQRYIWVTGEMFDLTLPSPTGHLSFGGLPEDHLEEPLHNQDHFLKTY